MSAPTEYEKFELQGPVRRKQVGWPKQADLFLQKILRVDPHCMRRQHSNSTLNKTARLRPNRNATNITLTPDPRISYLARAQHSRGVEAKLKLRLLILLPHRSESAARNLCEKREISNDEMNEMSVLFCSELLLREVAQVVLCEACDSELSSICKPEINCFPNFTFVLTDGFRSLTINASLLTCEA